MSGNLPNVRNAGNQQANNFTLYLANIPSLSKAVIIIKETFSPLWTTRLVCFTNLGASFLFCIGKNLIWT